jgi:hypothetical protein
MRVYAGRPSPSRFAGPSLSPLAGRGASPARSLAPRERGEGWGEGPFCDVGAHLLPAGADPRITAGEAGPVPARDNAKYLPTGSGI